MKHRERVLSPKKPRFTVFARVNSLATARSFVLGAGLLAAVVLAVVSCANLPTTPAVEPTPVSVMPAPAEPATALQLHYGDSRIELRLDPAGPLARLGHRHVIVTKAVRGAANFDPSDLTKAYFSAAFPVNTLQVDLPEERAAAGEGFNTVPDAAAIAGTREHMLSPVLLDAARFPEIGLRLQQLSTVEPTAGTFLATVVFAIKGAEFARPLTVTVRALDAESVDGDGSHGSYVASGTWSVTHAELGLTPYSAAGGLLKVGDPIEVRFRLLAKPR